MTQDAFNPLARTARGMAAIRAIESKRSMDDGPIHRRHLSVQGPLKDHARFLSRRSGFKSFMLITSYL
jgi:hypothetical protein